MTLVLQYRSTNIPKKSSRNLRFPAITWHNIHTEDPHKLSSPEQDLVNQATGRPGLVHPFLLHSLYDFNKSPSQHFMHSKTQNYVTYGIGTQPN